MVKFDAQMACDVSNSIAFILMCLIVKNNQLKGVDLYIANYILLGIILFLVGRVTNKKIIIQIYHYLLAFIVCIIPLVSNNRDILFWHLLFIIWTLSSRKLFGGCIIRKIEKSKGQKAITQNSFTKKFNWDLIFPFIGFLSLLKLYLYY